MDFSKYYKRLETYQGKLPTYLQTPGSIIMNQIQLFYDIMEGYKQVVIENLWQNLNIDFLLSEYFSWRDKNPTADDDLDWEYTDLVEKICKTYDVIREHPVGLLRSSHMLRLLKIKSMGVGFDGTKEKLEEILEAVFPADGSIKFVTQTITNETDHATAKVYLIKAGGYTNFDTLDEDLFEGGYYFLKLLGIKFVFEIINEASLVYDSTIYDDSTENNIEDPNGNSYDKGGLI